MLIDGSNCKDVVHILRETLLFGAAHRLERDACP